MNLPFALLATSIAALAQPPDVAQIMARVAANQQQAQQLRTEFTFHQKQLLRLNRGNSRVAREERREYDVAPAAHGVAKTLTHFEGRYEHKGRYVAYDQPGYEYREMDIDGELIDSLSEDMMNEKHSRDGLDCNLFPLTADEQRKYDFKLLRAETFHGREVYRIGFQPKPHADSDQAAWKGEALIDAAEFQPVTVYTTMAIRIPRAVKILLGTDIRGLGFSITYQRFDDGIWFPVSYGGEFQVRALFFYGRKISVSMVNENFRRTRVDSHITYVMMQR